MTQFEFDSQLKRLGAVLGKPWDAEDTERRQALRGELLDRFQRHSSDRWTAIISRVLDTHDDPKRLPLIKAFRDADKWIADNTPRNQGAHEIPRAERIRMCEEQALTLAPSQAKIALASWKKGHFAKHPSKEAKAVVDLMEEIAAAQPSDHAMKAANDKGDA